MLTGLWVSGGRGRCLYWPFCPSCWSWFCPNLRWKGEIDNNKIFIKKIKNTDVSNAAGVTDGPKEWDREWRPKWAKKSALELLHNMIHILRSIGPRSTCLYAYIEGYTKEKNILWRMMYGKEHLDFCTYRGASYLKVVIIDFFICMYRVFIKYCVFVQRF